MRIAFCSLHPYWHGLANNGGSCTIIRAVRALRELGHEACIVTKTDRHTWLKHDKPRKKIPKDTDVCIAMAIKDIPHMLKKAPKAAMTAYWARPVETWQRRGEKMVDVGVVRWVDKLFVNSEWQLKYLEKYNPTLIYQGVDFESWRDYDIRQWNRLRIGFLVSSLPRKRYKDVKAIIKGLGSEYRKSVLTTEKKIGRDVTLDSCDALGVNARGEALRGLYNCTNVWVATSEQEGLHNVPMEAALCGCILVCNDSATGGTGDYCIDGETGYTYQHKDTESAVEVIKQIDGPRPEMVARVQKLIRRKIGTPKENMAKLVETLTREG